MEKIDVLLVGGGGREHALAWKLAQSPRLGRLYAAPGNPGIAVLGECVPVQPLEFEKIVRLAGERQVGLVVVGPEAPLAAGLADRLRQAGIRVFGPSAAAARIESSKAFARELMRRAAVPQPEHARFRDLASASTYLDGLAARGIETAVVKASGLAAGKGAVVCDSLEEARTAAREMLVDHVFGESGSEILIEERMEGEEASFFVVTDGEAAAPLLSAQDYKRALDDDRGPNTGGMGSYAPAPLLTPELCAEAMERVVRPTLRALSETGAPFQGCLYAGLMNTTAGLRVVEFNCRFGDPETQAVLPLLDEDLLELFLAAAERRLEERALRWKPERAVTVVLASGGYPGSFESGKPISGIEEAEAAPGVTVTHAGTARREGRLVTAGGRVLGVTATGNSFGEARDRAYQAAEKIRFEERQFRRDIAERVVESRSTAGPTMR